MAKFKIGDKVRVLDAEAIIGGFDLTNGKGYDVVDVDDDGDITIIDDDNCRMLIFVSEFKRIELINAKPTKKQRISALESEVSALKAELAYVNQTVEALKQAQVRTDVDKIADRLAELVAGETIEPVQTPNELRKAIIAEARAFVAETATFINTDYSWRNTHIPLHTRAGTLRVNFEVNAKKRTVVALVYLKFTGTLLTKAIAKCAPGDVFNADIGKAIALGRALGLDVSKFEQAVQPTEVTVGMRIRMTYNGSDKTYEVIISSFEDAIIRYTEGSYDTRRDVDNEAIIIDDTEAQYE